MSKAEAIEALAADWLMRREQPGWTEADRKQLDDWLDQSFAHKAAFWRLEHGWRMVDRIGALAIEPAGFKHGHRRWWKGSMPAAIAASLAMLLIGTITYVNLALPEPVPQVRYSTALGKHSTVPLADGSQLELNTATALRVALSNGKREVWLDKGEAYFEIKHRPDLPFVVHAGPRTITVLGTKFLVRRDGDRMRLAVVQGRVRMDEASRGEQGPAAIVSAGNMAFTDGNSTLVVAKSPAQLMNELRWREGMLVFDQVTLSQAAAEFNRYNSTQLIITNPAVASIRIGGNFRTANAAGFAALLNRAYGLHIKQLPDKIIIE